MEFSVPDMSCGHCTAAIEKALIKADPAAKVRCDLSARRVRVQSTLSAEAVKSVLNDIGYSSDQVTA